jgi:hypothetical protein
VAGTTAGTLKFANATNSNLGQLQIAAPTGTGTATYTLPSIAGGSSDNICLQTLANCTGGGVTTTGGTQNYITKYNNAGATQITNSQLYDDGNFVGVNTTTNSGQLSVVAAGTQTGLYVQGAASGTSPLAIIKSGGSTGDLLQLQNSSGTPLVKVDSTGNLTVTNQITGGNLQIGTPIIAAAAQITFSSGKGIYLQNQGSDESLTIVNQGCGAISTYGGPAGSTVTTCTSASPIFTVLGASGQAGAHLVVQGGNGATGDLLQLKTNSGTILTAFDKDGKLVFGPSGSQDTNLYRSAADTLKTDDSLIVQGTLTINTLGAADTQLLCYNGSNQIAACSPTAGTGSFILNGTSQQTSANFNIDGNGTIGTDLTVGGITTLNGQVKIQNNTVDGFSIQNTSSNNLSSAISVDTSYTNTLISNGDFETNTNGWTALAGATLSTTTSQHLFGKKSLHIAAPTSGDGAKYDLTLLPNTTYAFTLNIRSTAPIDFNAGYNLDGVDNDNQCLTLLNGPNTESGWVKLSCIITTGPTFTSAYLYIKNNDVPAIDAYIDGVSGSVNTAALALTSNAFRTANIALGGTITSPLSLQNETDSSTAFSIQSADSSPVFTVDTIHKSLTAFSDINNGTVLNLVASGSASALRIYVDSTTGDAINSNGFNVDNQGNVTIGQSGGVGSLLVQGSNFSAFEVQNTTSSNLSAPISVDTSASAYGDNLVANGDYESGSGTGGWVAAETATVTNSTTQSLYGSHAVRIEEVGTAADATDGAVYTLGALNANTDYYASYYVYNDSDSTVINTTYNGSTSECGAFLLSTFKIGGWTRVNCTFTTSATPSSDQLEVFFDSGASGDLYLDGFTIQDNSDGHLDLGASAYRTANLAINGVVTSPLVIQGSSNSTSALQVQATNGNPLLNVDTLNEQVSVVSGGVSSALSVVNFNNSCAFNCGLQVVSSSDSGSGLYVTSGTTTQSVFSVSPGGILGNADIVAFRPNTDSALAFTVQDSSSNNLLLVNTLNKYTTLSTDLLAKGSATITTATTSGTGTNTTTLTFSTTTSFANGDVILIDNAGQDYYTRITAGGNAASVTVSPAITFEAGRTVTKYNTQNIGAETSSNNYTTQADRFFQGYFLGGVVTGAGSTTLSDGRLTSTTNMNFNSPSYTFKPLSDSSSAFQLQNATGASLLTLDTTNSKLALSSTALTIGNITAPGAPTVTAGTNTGGTLSGGTNTTYYYKVSAITSSGETIASAEQSINGSAFTPISAPTAPTVAASGTAGVLNGSYTYKVTYLTANGETTGGTTSAVVSPASKQVNITNIPTGPAGTLYRRIYRTSAGGADGTQKLVITLNDNTTTSYTDNVADASLRGSLPGSNTARTDTNRATVTFSAVTGATSYRIYRGTTSGLESAYQTTASSPFTDSGAAGTTGTPSGAFQLQGASGTVLNFDQSTGKLQMGSITNCASIGSDANGNLTCTGTALNLSRLDIYGHSITAGGGASSTNYRYTTRVAQMLHAQENNKAIGGAILSWGTTGSTGDGGYAWFLQNATNTRTAAPYLPNSPAYVIGYGLNDLAALGSSGLTPFDSALRTVIARARAGAVFEAETAANITFAQGGGASNGWSNVGCFGACSGTDFKFSSVNGNTFTINVPSDFPGGAIDVGLIANADGTGGVVNFTTDAVGSGSIDTRNAGASAHTTGLVKRFTGLSAGAHTIVGTIASATGLVNIDYWEIESTTPPIVVLPTNPKPVDYSLWNTWPFQPNDSDVSILNNHIRSIAAEFDSSVVIADMENTLQKDPANFFSDKTHPNDIGNAKLAAVLYKALSTANINSDALSYVTSGTAFTGINQVFQNSSDSTTAFQIQNAGGTTLFDADTTNSRIGIGTSAPTAKVDIIAANDGIRLASGSSSAYTGLFLNRTGIVGTEGTLAIAGGSNQFLTGAVAGDLVLRNVSGRLLFGTGSSATSNLTIANDGSVKFLNSTNSTTSFQVQNAAQSPLFNIDTSTTNNLVTNGSFEDGIGVTGWTAKGSAGAPTQVTTQQWQGNNALQEVTTTAANDGVKYNFTFTSAQQYTLSFYAKVASGSITDINVGRQDNGSTDTDCLTGQTLTTNWKRFSCTFTAGAQSGTPNFYIKKTGSSAETFFVDGVQLQTGGSTTGFDAGGTLQLNGVINSPTLFQNKSDSTAALQIQNAAGTGNLFVADTLNGLIGIGQAPAIGSGALQVTGGLSVVGATINLNASSNNNTNINTGTSTGSVSIGNSSAGAIGLQSSGNITLNSATRVTLDNGNASTANILVLDSSSVAPTAVQGAMYFDSTNSLFKCSLNGSTYTSACFGTTSDLQSVYDNSATPALITTSSSTKNFLIRAGVSSSSTATFQIQDTGSVALLSADTTNHKIKIGNGTPTLSAGSTGALFVSDTAEIIGQVLIGTSTNGVAIDGTNHRITYTGTARQTRTIALAPEFSGMVLHADGAANTGSLTSDIDTASGFHSYYNWTTTQASAQDYDMYIRIPMPRDWAAWNTNSNNTNIVICYNVWTDDTTSSVITSQLLDTANADSGTFTATPTSNSTWQQKCSTTQYNAAGTKTFTVNGNTYITLDLHFAAGQNKNTRIGEITMDYLSQF